MERTIPITRAQPALSGISSQTARTSAHKVANSSRQNPVIFEPTRAAGNGIFSGGDRAPKSAIKRHDCSQRRKSCNSMSGNPAENGLFEVASEFRGSKRLGGGRTRARTWDPMIKSQRYGKIFQRLFRHVHVSSNIEITVEFSLVGIPGRRERVIGSNRTVGGLSRVIATANVVARRALRYRDIAHV